jgi:hypothetical protein
MIFKVKKLAININKFYHLYYHILFTNLIYKINIYIYKIISVSRKYQEFLAGFLVCLTVTQSLSSSFNSGTTSFLALCCYSCGYALTVYWGWLLPEMAAPP